jgi:hypothetical protein
VLRLLLVAKDLKKTQLTCRVAQSHYAGRVQAIWALLRHKASYSWPNKIDHSRQTTCPLLLTRPNTQTVKPPKYSKCSWKKTWALLTCCSEARKNTGGRWIHTTQEGCSLVRPRRCNQRRSSFVHHTSRQDTITSPRFIPSYLRPTS